MDDHSICGGCDDDANCTWRDSTDWSLFIVLLVGAVLLAMWAR